MDEREAERGWRTDLITEESARLAHELARELPEGHVLKGQGVCAIACDGDDVLFALDDGRRCVVHLTWSVESDPAWPHCEFVVA